MGKVCLLVPEPIPNPSPHVSVVVVCGGGRMSLLMIIYLEVISPVLYPLNGFSTGDILLTTTPLFPDEKTETWKG